MRYGKNSKRKRRKSFLTSGSKKGSFLLFGVIFLVALFMFGLYNIITHLALKPITDDIIATSTVNESIEAASIVIDSMPSVWDSVFVMALVFFSLLGLYGAYIIDTSPILFILMIVMLSAMVISAAILSNAWTDITDTPAIDFEHRYPMTNTLIDNFVIVVITYIVLTGGVLFIRR